MLSIIMPAYIQNEQQLGWLNDAIISVQAQDSADWELIVVNDHSTVSWKSLVDHFKDKRIRGAKTKGDGRSVSHARNLAASMASHDLLLPLDADDMLSKNAITEYLNAWHNGGSEQGIVYSDIMMFGEVFRRHFNAPEYDFGTLLRSTFMTIGCLHRKSDWQRVEGWKPILDIGFEDWEYWIAMGELGICGYHVKHPLYWYRRHAEGRVGLIRTDNEIRDEAYAVMRSLHLDTYNGRWPVGCCPGTRSRTSKKRSTPGHVAAVTGGRLQNPAKVRYTGKRRGSFGVRGKATGTRYRVPGHGGTFSVDERDLPMLQRLGGGIFRRV